MNLRQLSRITVNKIKDGLEDIESQDPVVDLNTSITLDETTAELPEWLKKFIKASKDMPYFVDEDTFEPDENRVTVVVSGYYDGDPSSYKSKWLKKAAEADAQVDHLNEDRWNPSWDVAEDALAEVCQKLGLTGYDDEVYAAPESDIFYISPED